MTPNPALLTMDHSVEDKPSEDRADTLSDLLADARAIPAEVFRGSEASVRRAERAAVPAQRAELSITAATQSLVEAAGHTWTDFSR